MISFPVGTDANSRAANSDFDADGVSNVIEFGLQTDPDDNTDFPAPPAPIVNPDDTVSFTLTKRPNSVAGYAFLVSKDGDPAVKITATNPEWDIVEDSDTTLTITTKVAPPLGTVFTAQYSVTAVNL